MSSQEMASVPIGGNKKPTFSRELSLGFVGFVGFVVQLGTRTKHQNTGVFVDLDGHSNLCTYQSPQRCLTNLEHLLFLGSENPSGIINN